MLSSNRNPKKKKNSDGLGISELSSVAKKSKKDDPSSALSRSGRVRKKSAKLMQMEDDFNDLDELDADLDDDGIDVSRSGRIRKKSLKLIDSVTDFDIEPFKKSKPEKHPTKLDKNSSTKKIANFLHSQAHHEHKLKIPIYPQPGSLTAFSLSHHQTSTPLDAHITDDEDDDDEEDDDDDDDDIDEDEEEIYIEPVKKKFLVSGKDPLKKKLFSPLPPLTIGIPDMDKNTKKSKKKNASSNVDKDPNVTVKEGNSGLRLKLILSPKEKLSSQAEADLSSVDVNYDFLEQTIHEKPNKVKKIKLKNQSRSDKSHSQGFYHHEIIGNTSFQNTNYGGKVPKISSKKKKKKKHTKKGKFSDTESPDLCYNADDDDFSNLVIAEDRDVPKKKKKVKKTKKTKHSVPKVEEESAFFDSAEEKFGIDSDESEGFLDIPSSESIHSDTVAPSFKVPQIFADKKTSKKPPKEGKSKSKKSRSKAKPKKPRPMTAYMLWCQGYRKKIVSEGPDMDFAAISKKLGEIWQSLPEKEKMAWRRKAKKQANKGSTIISTGKPQVQNPTKTTITKIQVKPEDPQTSPLKTNGTSPIDVAAHLKLLGESLSIIGQRLTEQEGQIAVQGTLSVLLDSTLCALGPILCLTSQVREIDGCPKFVKSNILDNIAFVMPGL